VTAVDHPPWDFPRSPVPTRVLTEVAQAHGMSQLDCLRGTGLSSADLADPDRTVEPRQEVAVARNLIGHVGALPGLGVEAGLRLTLGSAGGILGFAVLSSRTVRDAITIGLRYLALSPAFVHVLFQEVGERAVISFGDNHIPPDVRSFFIERDLAAIGQLLPLLFGDEFPWHDVALELRLEPADYRALSAQFPGIKVTPARARNLLTMPREVLERALPQADPQTATLCQQRCHELLDRRRRRRGTAAMVRSLLVRDPSDMPSMATAARQLRVDPRTLNRHLAREQTSYRALITETREALAIELLATTGLTVAEVARRLGYSEVAAFSRAFRFWTGAPPSTYRRRVAQVHAVPPM
jgi:AraC-like DNA-binding protein